MPAVRAILDFGDSPRTVYVDPVQIVVADSMAAVRPALQQVENACRDGATAVGFVAYEAAAAFDSALEARAPSGVAPLLWFALFDRAQIAPAGAATAMPRLAWRADTDRAAYDAALSEIRAAIAAGDVYQVNHTIRFAAACAVEPLALYDALVSPGHGRYHALIDTPGWSIISASPELFFDSADGVVTTRPMKGTIRRGRWLAEDRAAAAQLAASSKDRAENLMIVDLLRNDLGRIAQFGSVAVPKLFEIETYPTVHQMTSTITARLRSDVRLDDIFTAMFPCGSVTGAPKVTAMRCIARLEHTPRGAYCGAVGVVRPDGSATFNVAIRTLLLDRHTRTISYGAGGGITWDSSADAEYDEVVAKAALLHEPLPPFELLETMRLHEGEYARLSLHLERLHESAMYWGFPQATAEHARRALEHECDSARTGAWRVRLTAARDGTIAVTRTPLAGDEHGASATPAAWGAAAAANRVRPVALAQTPVSSRDRMLFHKTTARAMYDAHRHEQPRAFDVLLHNEEGCITEFTTGNVVVEMNGERLTPPRECGLLAGTFREQLLRSGAVREAVLSVAHVRSATRVWLINSVREWVAVALE